MGGVFIEVFDSTDKYLKQLEKMLNSWLYDGYWIYTHHELSKNSKIYQKDIESLRKDFGYYEERMVDKVDPGFFIKLRTLNSKI